MGSCMSCKAGKEAHEYTTSPAAYPTQRTCYYYSMENGPFSSTSQGENKGLAKRSTPYTRGQATLFGFKRRSASAVPTPVTNTSTPILDNAGSLAGSKTASQESLNSISPIPSGRSTPRLSRPKKDADGNLIRTNRFGFRGPTVASITNKVSDSNCNSNPPVMTSHHASSHHSQENQSVLRVEKPRAKGGGKIITPVTPGMKHSAHSIASSGDSAKTKQQLSLIPQPEHHEHGKASRFTLQTSLLPRPQYPIRLTSVDSEKTTKGAKTAANNSTRKVSYHVSGGEESSSKEGSLNGDSGIGSHQSGAACYGETDTLQGIEQLDSSPTFGLRRNRKPRTLEMVVNGQYFDVRDLKDEDSSAADDPNVITEISLISIPSSKPTNGTIKTVQNTGIVQQRSMQYQRQIANDNKRQGSSFTASSDEFRDDGLVGEGEEKALRDRSRSEKTESIKDHITPCSIEDQEDWGHGEAMAEEYSSSSEDGRGARCGSSPESMNLNAATTITVPEPAQQPRPVMLTIEDPLFAAIAAAACPTMIEDETSPVDSLFSSSTATSTASEILEKDQPASNPLPKDDNKSMQDHDKGNAEGSAHRSANMLSPDSPGTPTNASTSLSLSVSEGRDFLIDDEIADQPGLTFDDGANTTARGHIESGDMATSSGGCTSQLLSMTENTATLIDSTSKPVPKQRVSASFDGSPVRTRRISRTGSVDTLSPCESIASDDLMLDYERSEGSLFDCTAESRLDNSSGVMYQREEVTLVSELESHSDSVLRELSSLLGAHVKEKGLVSGRPVARVLRSRTGSTPDSPRSLDPKARVAGSPLRPPRQVTPGSETEDSSLRLDRGTYQYMYQDIVNIKTMLLKLKRVLQENEENSLMMAETLNPFDGTLKNGLFYTLANSEVMAAVNTEDGSESGVGHSPQEEVADLRRQVVFLQQQLDEKERTIQLLQLQMTKYTNSDATSNAAGKESCNAATQTERVRPVSAGPSLLQSLPSENNMGPLVSLTDTWDRRRLPSLGELRVGRQPVVTTSKLPGKGVWKQRTNLAASELVAAVASRSDQSGIPTRKYSAVSMSSTLPRRSHIGSNSIATKT